MKKLKRLFEELENKKYIIVDLDGTVCNIEHRLDLLKDKKYDEFFLACKDDKPYKDVIEVLNILSKSFEIVFCSGRSDIAKIETIEWLDRYTEIDYRPEYLLMRKNGDRSKDEELKPKLLEEVGIKMKDILFVLEDRNSVVEMYRKNGVRCWQVQDGDF